MPSFLRHLRSLDRPALTQTPQASSHRQTDRANQSHFGWRGAVGLLGSVLILQLAPGRALAGDLEFSVGSYASPPNGPVTTAGPASLLENTTGSTFVTYTPTITMGVSFSNQQYTNGLSIGAIAAPTSKAIIPAAVFNRMNTFGSPTDAMFTSTPNSPVGTGISVINNYAFLMYASVEPLFDAGLPTNGRYYYGDVTLTFSRPVSDPVIQMVGMGGTVSTTVSGVTTTHGHSAEFDLQGTGLTASKLSGSTYLDVTNNKITNNATIINSGCSTGAACGSVKIAGTNITSLTFKVYVRGDSQTGAWSTSTAVVATAANAGDSFLFGGVSIAKPVTVSGTVRQDANGLTDSTIGGTGTNAGGLFANLVDTAGNVVASTSVAANGTYSFLAIGAGQYTVSLSTTAGVQGTTAPASSLPTNWVNTGEGTAASGDGTVDGRTSITVAAVDLTGVNFGIEQLPTAVGGTATSQTNPGGTATAAVATTLFTGSTDPDGTVASYKITAFPSNATRITINGTNYTSASFPGGGVTVTTAQLAGMVVDPIDGAVTVGIPFQALDNAGQISSNTATASLPFTAAPVTVSGTVFDDADGSKLQNAEAGTNAGGLNAVLVNSSNQVVATTAVAANGTYTFSNVPTNATYTVRITTATATVGAAPPAVALPANWVSTGENLNSAIDGTVDSILSVPVTTTNVTGVNLGIEQLPTAVGGTATSQANPTGTNTVPVASTLFTSSTDPDGTVTSYRITAFPTNATSITINGTNYTSGTFPGGGVTITTAQLAGMVVDPIDGAVTVGILFRAIDNAGQLSSNTSTVNLPFTAAPVTITGTVFDDGDGSKLQNAEAGTNAGGLNAVLVNSSNQVVASTAVAANGTYTFSNVPANATYSVRITTATATVGAAPPAVALPANWVSTGENLNGSIDGTVDSILSVPVTTTNVTGVNLGIEQRPTAVGGTAASQANPTGTNTVAVASTLFTGSTDPDGTVTSYKITAFPTNATSITINGTNYTSGTFPVAGVTVTTAQLAGMVVDPIDGAVTVGIPFQAIDNAGQSSSNTATVTLPFTANANVLLVKRITAINGDRTKNPNDNTPLNVFVDDTTSSKAADDNNSKWVTNYLKGAINAGKVKPGDTIEYTIYFLNAGNANANTVRICDRLQPNQTFQPNGYGTGAGIQLQLGTSPVIDLTNANDSSDRTQFIAAGDSVPTNCNITAANTDGTLVVDITGPAATGNPTLTALPGAITAGTPNDSYGFFRFITQVNP